MDTVIVGLAEMHWRKSGHFESSNDNLIVNWNINQKVSKWINVNNQ